ncbi:MAG: hypothetical protein AB7P17_14440 [Nitrospirales bacterium]
MKRFLTGLLAVLFVCGLTGFSTAGMMDDLKGQADQATDTMESKGAEASQSIKAQGTAKEKGGSMMDQVKEGAKEKTEDAKEKTNEMIDNVGK